MLSIMADMTMSRGTHVWPCGRSDIGLEDHLPEWLETTGPMKKFTLESRVPDMSGRTIPLLRQVQNASDACTHHKGLGINSTCLDYVLAE